MPTEAEEGVRSPGAACCVVGPGNQPSPLQPSFTVCFDCRCVRLLGDGTRAQVYKVPGDIPSTAN